MLVLVAHGSRDGRWRASVEGVVAELRRETGPDRVRLAYMDLTPPTLRDVVSEAARSGVTRISVLPLFLAAEGHVERDIAPLVEEIRGEWPSLTVDLLAPVGQQPEFREALGRIERRSRGSDSERERQTP